MDALGCTSFFFFIKEEYDVLKKCTKSFIKKSLFESVETYLLSSYGPDS
jgi:hypothetical protein